MLLSRDAQRLRPFLLGALFLSSLGHHRLAIGYTMTVWSDPYDSWGCVGACGGWDGGGFYDPYYSGDQGDGGGGDGGEPGSSADNPIDVDVEASGSCSPIYTREGRAESAIKAWIIVKEGLSGCTDNEGHGHYYFVRYAEDGRGSVFLWQGECMSSTFLTEIRSQCE